MPSRSNSLDVVIQIVLHTTATHLVSTVEPAIPQEREREANIWLPHARKIAHKEQQQPLDSSMTTSDESSSSQLSYKRGSLEQFWLSVWSTYPKNPRQPSSLDLVLACTSHHLGKYPIFLYSNHPARSLTNQFLSARMPVLVDRLSDLVKTSRVFSVFGPTPLTRSFVTIWSRQTCSVPMPEDFYAAKFTTCTRSTLAMDSPLPHGHVMRLAEPSDAEAAAVLCKEFADDSVYFPLSLRDALKEAQEMIRNRQLWLYCVPSPNGRGQIIASIVGCTRTTTNVAAINKVYTNPMCRSQGCARRLVHLVCHYWLYDAQKHSVVLYVAHGNEAAERAYHRVGFEGLCGTIATESLVEDWLETGFENTERGHW